MQMKDDTENHREYETETPTEIYSTSKSVRQFERKREASFISTAHFISPKPENLSHPQGPQDLRSNRKSPRTHGPIVLSPPYKIPPLPL